jgi:hypothetical protein
MGCDFRRYNPVFNHRHDHLQWHLGGDVLMERIGVHIGRGRNSVRIIPNIRFNDCSYSNIAEHKLEDPIQCERNGDR